MDLSVAVLSSLGGGHLNNLARPVLITNIQFHSVNPLIPYLDHNESSLTQSRTLHGEGGGSARIPLVEIKIISHFRLVKRDDL